MEPPPPTPKPDPQPPELADLPLFAPRPPSAPRVLAPPPILAKPPAGLHLPRPAARGSGVRWASPMTWLPVLALAMIVTGIWLLLPPMTDVAPATPVDRSFPTVVIDAGHGGHDSGAINNGLREKDLTLDTALRLERHLRTLGFPVVLTRRDDRYLELFDRAEIANRIPRALFLSIHFNDNPTAKGDGVETFYAEQKAPFSDDGWSFASMLDGRPQASPVDQGQGFARVVQAAMVAQLGATDRGAKPRQLAVVRLTRCPAILVEGGFLNNPGDARKLAREDYRELLATALAEGVGLYYRELTPRPAPDLAQR